MVSVSSMTKKWTKPMTVRGAACWRAARGSDSRPEPVSALLTTPFSASTSSQL